MNHSFLSRRSGLHREVPYLRVVRAPSLILCGGILALAVSARVFVRAHAHGSWSLGLLGLLLAACSAWSLGNLALLRLRELQSARNVRRALSSSATRREARSSQRRSRHPRAGNTIPRARPTPPVCSRDSGLYFTPYPFSVWSYHDQAPTREAEPRHAAGERTPRVLAWLWTSVVVSIVLMATVWLGFSVVRLWTALA